MVLCPSHCGQRFRPAADVGAPLRATLPPRRQHACTMPAREAPFTGLPPTQSGVGRYLSLTPVSQPWGALQGCHSFFRSRLQAASPRRQSGLGRPFTAGIPRAHPSSLFPSSFVLSQPASAGFPPRLRPVWGIMVLLSGRFSGLSAGFSHGQDHLFGNQPAYYLAHKQ
jgi:hypothetical protein